MSRRVSGLLRYARNDKDIAALTMTILVSSIISLMNPVLLFFALLFVVLVVVTWWLLRALKHDRLRESPRNTESTNVEALRVERSELTRDHKLGLMSDAALNEAERELEVRVLRESELDNAPQPTRIATGKRTKWMTATCAALLPMAAIGMYFLLGAPHAVIPEVVRPEAAKQESQMDELFRVAEERLKVEPNDARGWYLLARAKASIGRFDGAMKDYATLMKLTPNDADAWADYADAAAGMAEGKMAGKPLEFVSRALAIDAKQPKALLLRGTHEIQINDLAAAEKTFTLAKSIVDPTTGFASIADNALKDIAARKAGATIAGASTATANAGSSSANAGTSSVNAGTTPAAAGTVPATLLSAKISLSGDAVKAATAKDAAVFIVVRAVDRDGGPPLAAKKLIPSALNSPIAISASDAMIGGDGLKPGSEVSIEARVSVSGQPLPKPGDWKSARQRVTLSADATVTLTIGEKIE
jgi:cytochrome c-type biogenesis protein CcmH